jgi:hypothetical protein
MKRNRNSRPRAKHTSRKRRRGQSRRRGIPALQNLSKHLAALLAWAQKVEGLSAPLRNSYRGIENEIKLVNAEAFIKAVQKDRPILEELLVWSHEASVHVADPASREPLTVLEEGAALVGHLFRRLSDCFDITIIQPPATTIPTPRPAARQYKFSERFKPGVPVSRVLFPGLKQGSKTLCPCEIEQIVVEEEPQGSDPA